MMSIVRESLRSTGPMSRDTKTSKLLHGRWRKLNDKDAASAATMYSSGQSVAQIAKRFGVSRQSMHGTLKRLGVQMRSRKRYGTDNHFYRGGRKAIDAAQNKLEKAVFRGSVIRPDTCERCGRTPPRMKDGRSRIQAHHPDYSKPLKVAWLCQMCHHQEHANV